MAAQRLTVMRKPLATAALAGTLLLLAAPAHAYLDPGTGSYVFQMIAAAVITGGFILKAGWQRLRGFLSRRRPGQSHPPDES